MLYTVAALARRLGVPFRSGGSLTASKLPDAQAAYESAATLIPTLMAGTNFVLHAAGWLEGGLAVGYEKFVLDADQLGMMATFAAGLDLSDNGQALDAISEHTPGEHFLGTAHTLANFETAFYRSETADNSSFEQWVEDGSLDAAQRANRLWKERLAAYEPPPIDDAVDAERTTSTAARPSCPTRSPEAVDRPGGGLDPDVRARRRALLHHPRPPGGEVSGGRRGSACCRQTVSLHRTQRLRPVNVGPAAIVGRAAGSLVRPWPPPARPAPRRGGDARERILSTAYTLFCRHGIRAVGVDTIIERSGVAKMTVYRHFRSKDALVLAVLDRREQLWTRRWLEAEVRRRADAAGRSPAGHLRRVRRLVPQAQLRGLPVRQRAARVRRPQAPDPPGLPRAAGPDPRVPHRAGHRGRRRRIPTHFARQWHILMKGSIVSAGEGDVDAARRAQEIGRLLLAAKLPVPVG